MSEKDLSCEEKAEIMRKRNHYRDLILSGHLVLPHARAAQLLGPDCLYHLYSARKSRGSKKKENFIDLQGALGPRASRPQKRTSKQKRAD